MPWYVSFVKYGVRLYFIKNEGGARICIQCSKYGDLVISPFFPNACLITGAVRGLCIKCSKYGDLVLVQYLDAVPLSCMSVHPHLTRVTTPCHPYALTITRIRLDYGNHSRSHRETTLEDTVSKRGRARQRISEQACQFFFSFEVRHCGLRQFTLVGPGGRWFVTYQAAQPTIRGPDFRNDQCLSLSRFCKKMSLSRTSVRTASNLFSLAGLILQLRIMTPNRTQRHMFDPSIASLAGCGIFLRLLAVMPSRTFHRLSLSLSLSIQVKSIVPLQLFFFGQDIIIQGR